VKLPEFSEDAAPEFGNALDCKEWLQTVPLANVPAAQRELLGELEEFNRFPTKPSERLAVMEALREAVHFVQLEQVKKFSNRALPMTEAETAAFDDANELWEQMQVGYSHCLESAIAGEGGMRSQAGLVCQRVLSYVGLKMLYAYRAYRQVPARDWRALHEAYAYAEKLDVAEDGVKDLMNRDVHDSSPRIAYARAVLMGLCSPNELGQRALTFVAFLLERWAAKLEVLEKPVNEGEGLAPLVADLAGEACPERLDSPPSGASLRYLDTRSLAKSLRNRVGLLRRGESPAKLALGEDCVQPSCEQQLVHLFRQWCQAKPARAADRKRALSTAQVCNEFAAIHYYIGGRGFRQPVEQKELTQKEREQIATFGRVSTREEDDYSNVHGFLVESWQLEDESAQGLRIVRKADTPGKRYAHGQLVAVRPADAKTFMLGQVRWVMAGEAGDLHAGIKLLAGVPGAVAVRPTGVNVQSEKFVQALSLGAVAAINQPTTLVLPTGWFKPKRVIELFSDTEHNVRLLEVIERGSDFERVTYEREK
jgi:cyclic-di-GMP-binding protein